MRFVVVMVFRVRELSIGSRNKAGGRTNEAAVKFFNNTIKSMAC
jgi:hypothetical protein